MTVEWTVSFANLITATSVFCALYMMHFSVIQAVLLFVALACSDYSPFYVIINLPVFILLEVCFCPFIFDDDPT